MVLVYIGALSAMVCSVLLAVQCCVAGQLENRKRGIGVNSGNRHMRVVGSNGGFLLPVSRWWSHFWLNLALRPVLCYNFGGRVVDAQW